MKIIQNLFFTIIAIAAVTVSCKQSEEQSYLQRAEQIIDDYPDSALVLLSSISRANLQKEKDYARYSLLYAKALDKNYIDTTDISILSPAISFYEKKASQKELALSLYYLGRIQQNGRDYNASMLSFTRAEKILENTPNPPLTYLLKMAMAENFAYSYNTVEELRYIKEALQVMEESHLEKYRSISLYRYASSLANNKQYDEAFAIMDSLSSDKNCPVQIKKQSFVRSCYYKTYILRETPEVLKEKYNLALSGDYPMEVKDYCAYAYILGRNGDENAAETVFQQVKEMFPEGKTVAEIWEGTLAAKKGDYESAYRKLNSTLSEQDSIIRHTLQQSLSQTQKEYFQSELRETDHKRKQSRLTSLIVGLSAILIIGVLSFVFYWFWRYFSEKDCESKAKIDALTSTMKALEEDKTSSMEEIRKNYLSRMFRPLGELYSNYLFYLQHGKDPSVCQKDLLKSLDDINIEKEDGWFETVLNKETSGIPDRFRNDFPSLKADDYRLFCYYLAGFDATIISIILKIPSQGAVYTRKSRLRKIIADSSVADKEHYLAILL